jgi:hypothetical protein
MLRLTKGTASACRKWHVDKGFSVWENLTIAK